MWFSESIHMALTSLLANRLRSLLTMLGMIIGVAAVIIMVAIGMGVKKNITDSISGMGSNMVMLLPGSADSDDVQGAAGSDRNLTLDDAAAIAKEIPHIAHLSPVVNQTVPLVAGNKNWTTTLYGVTPDYLYIRNLATRSGLFLTADDLHSRRRVAVLGLTVAKKTLPKSKSGRANGTDQRPALPHYRRPGQQRRFRLGRRSGRCHPDSSDDGAGTASGHHLFAGHYDAGRYAALY